MSGLGLSRAAEALVGSPFRLHGRDPQTGLDCVGVLAIALIGAGRCEALPTGYRLRNRSLPDLAAIACACGLARAELPIQPGDVLMLRVSPCQLHLAIAGAGGGYVHAHAGLRRVVRQRTLPDWPIAGHWRLAVAV